VDSMRLGTVRVYAPVVRAPWRFPFHAGVCGYREVSDRKSPPICLIENKPIDRDGNTGRKRE